MRAIILSPCRTRSAAGLPILTAALLLIAGALFAPLMASAAPLPAIEKFAAEFRKEEGLFPLYRNPETGELFLELQQDQLGRDFIQFAYVENGIAGAGHFRGRVLENRILRFERRFNRIEIAAPNLAFTYDSKSALARAARANTSPALLATADIVAASGARLLVKADALFLTEALVQVKPSGTGGERPDLGKLSTRSAIIATHNHPANTDVLVDYVFETTYPPQNAFSDEDVADPRAVTVRLRHALIEIPQTDYQSRLDDFRVGYFTERRTDLTSTSSAPYGDLIQRFHLVKKDKDAPLSGPVTPITFWIENTTPLEFRESVKAGVLAWNAAFEAAGFSNVLRVEQQPDDAAWEAGDIRYNVIRWVASPTPTYSGFGPRYTNPLTGQILGADIILEFDFVTSRTLRERIIENGGAAALFPGRASPQEACGYGDYLRQGLRLGIAVLAAEGATQTEISELIHQSLRHLVAHEVGHTLGLTHNLKASSIRKPEELHLKGPNAKPISGSVMDYVPVNLAFIRAEQGQYYQTLPGPYDEWAITFGYRPDPEDPIAARALRFTHLARSTEKDLAFANDADDMRSAGKGIDPHAMVYDLSDDPISWARERLRLADRTLLRLRDRLPADGESHQTLRRAYFVLTAEKQGAAEILSRYPGGIHVEQALRGQKGADRPFRPVALTDQRRALDLLAEHIFAPEAFLAPEELLGHLQLQRRGYDFEGMTEDPKIHARALGIQAAALDHLLNPRVLARLSDSALYGNKLTVAEYFARLETAIFDVDETRPNSFRRNLQAIYVERLIAVSRQGPFDNRYDASARAAALASLRSIAGRMAPFPFGPWTGETANHRAYLRLLIADGLKR